MAFNNFINRFKQSPPLPLPNNQLCSKNMLKLPNGAVYTGEIEGGKPSGRGKMIYSNSERYEGQFQKGMKQGKGKYYYIKGELYIGDWFQNKKHGKGQYFYQNGTIYTGEFKDNKKHGHGKIEEQNGSFFEGDFVMNNKDKTGVYFDATKNKKYLLEYDNGKLMNQTEMAIQSLYESNSPLKKHEQLFDKKQKMYSIKDNNEREILSENNVGGQNFNSFNQLNYVSNYQPGIASSLKHFEDGQSHSKSSEQNIMSFENFLPENLLEKRVNDWNQNEVGCWLSQIGFGDCLQEFKENNIEGDTLLMLTNDDLKELGVGALGDRRILQREIQFLKLVFKNQCKNDPIAKYHNSDITLELIRQLEIKKQENQQIVQLSSSSSSSSSQDKDKEKDKDKDKEKDKEQERKKQTKKKKNFQNKMSMQSKVEQFLENKGIKLTFLIPKDQIQIIEPIGKGGYGQVFLGRWMGQDVAVKKYLKKQGFRNRHIGNFIEEVQVINKLQHPCIVLYMGMCIYDNQYGMVTEFLSGGSLFDYLHKRKQKLDLDTIVSICKDVALGMAYLHSKNVLHCDLKSSNVLIDQNWNVKLCDFGLSRINTTKNKKKNKNIRVGTPHWMAPEILKGEKYECESDVYSFGILLWEMLTSKIPYKDLSTAQIIGLVGNDESHHISIPNYDNKTLLDIFMMCTQREAKKRPSFKEIVVRLEVLEEEIRSTLSKVQDKPAKLDQ